MDQSDLPDQGCLRERKDDLHQAQINVAFEGCPTGSHTFYARTFELGLRQLAIKGVYVEPCGVDDGYWVPPHRIKKATLMDTAPKKSYPHPGEC